jgi:polysaccharide biosynthesis protein PslH
MRILFVTYGLPYPPDSGARMHDFHLIREIARHARVVVCSLAIGPTDPAHVAELRRFCEAVEVVPGGEGQRPFRAQVADGIRSFFAGRPLAMLPFHFPAMAAKLREMIVRYDIDLLQIEHSILSGYRDAVPPGHRCRTVLSFHNVASAQYRRMAHLGLSAGTRLQFGLKALLMQRWEARYAARFDHSLVVSTLDRDLLHAEDPSLPITVIENGVDATLSPLEAEAGNVLLFVGVLGYPPNMDAALFCCKAILPLVQREVPDIRLLLVGHAPPLAVRRLAQRSNVTVPGSVLDVLPYYQQACLSVVPLRAGGGTRLKILESMALGRPVVSTSIGCEGLDVRDGVHLSIADAPDEFARRVVLLLREPTLRKRFAANARRLVEERYHWPCIAEKLMDVYRTLLEPYALRMGGMPIPAAEAAGFASRHS